MIFDWDAFVIRLRTYPSGFHRVLPPCPADRVQNVVVELGKLPQMLGEMLARLNGAQLFCAPNPSVTLFGLTPNPPLPPFEWAPEWCIDTFTPKWRAAGTSRESDWAIAMTIYGGLILVDADETVKEWDTISSRCRRAHRGNASSDSNRW
jgi:hypothetical protein